MKQIEIEIVLNTIETTDTLFNKSPNILELNTNSNLSPIKFNGVNDLEIIEDIEELTHTLTFTLPLQNFILNSNGLFYSETNKDVVSYRYIYSDIPFAIFVKYRRETFVQIFKGYITEYEIVDDYTIRFTGENLMRFLKLSPKIKNSFNATINKNVIKDDLFVGESFNLRHFAYWMFRNDKTELYEKYYKNRYFDIIPFNHIYASDEVGVPSLFIDDYLHPSVILDKLNDPDSLYLRSFVRPNYVGYDGQPYFVPDYDLFIGYKNYLGVNVFDIKKEISFQSKSSPKLVGKDIDYANDIPFSYPYLFGTNAIYSHNIKYKDTKKSNLIVIVTPEVNGSLLDPVYYPADKQQAVNLFVNQKAIDLNKPNNVQKAEEVAKDIDFIRLKETDENTIRIKLPNLNVDSAKALAKQTYDNYKDEGYQGSFVCDGEPYIRIGDVVSLNIKISTEYELIKYYVDKVERRINDEGYTQTITLGNRFIQ